MEINLKVNLSNRSLNIYLSSSCHGDATLRTGYVIVECFVVRDKRKPTKYEDNIIQRYYKDILIATTLIFITFYLNTYWANIFTKLKFKFPTIIPNWAIYCKF